MSKPRESYALEDLRGFFVKRQFLVDSIRPILTQEEFDQLKDRQLSIDPVRLRYLRGFVAGWLRAKE